MLDPIQAQLLAEQHVFQLGQADPLRAAQILARAVKRQPPGAKLALLRVLAETLAADEPGFVQAAAAELTALAARQEQKSR